MMIRQLTLPLDAGRPRPHVGTSANVERTGHRDLTVSAASRLPEGVRHFDVDIAQVCPRCEQVELVVEGSADPNKPSRYLRNLAERLSIPALVVIHTAGDLEQRFPINMQLWLPPGTETVGNLPTGYRKQDRARLYLKVGWSAYHAILRYVHALHSC